MSVYLVSWDLNHERTNYSNARTAFVSHMETFEHVKDRGLDSVWFVNTSWTANEIDKYLRSKLDENDRLIVTKLHPDTHQGWLDPSVWNWIGERL